MKKDVLQAELLKKVENNHKVQEVKLELDTCVKHLCTNFRIYTLQ